MGCAEKQCIRWQIYERTFECIECKISHKSYSAVPLCMQELPPQPCLPIGCVCFCLRSLLHVNLVCRVRCCSMKMPASVCWTESLTSFYVQLAADRDVLRALDLCMNDLYELQVRHAHKYTTASPSPSPCVYFLLVPNAERAAAAAAASAGARERRARHAVRRALQRLVVPRAHRPPRGTVLEHVRVQ